MAHLFSIDSLALRRAEKTRLLCMSVALFVLVALSGCSDTVGDGDGDADTDGRSDTGDTGRPPRDIGGQDGTPDVPDAGELPDGDLPDRPDAVETTPCGEGDECPDGQICRDGGCRVPCEDELDCAAGEICFVGGCQAIACTSNADCEDEANPCTVGLCRDNQCQRRFVFGELPDQVEGNCARLICENGRPTNVADNSDLPPDDGIACTREACRDAAIATVNDHARCDDGNPNNGEERCVPAEGGCVNYPPPWLCEANIEPGWLTEELCGDGQDNNNNGQVDEGCPCDFGSTQRCYVGPPGTRGVGGCLDGIQQCINRTAPRWGECQGGRAVEPEVCDAKDNDCNGCVDDLDDCDGTLVCPTEDVGRPLTWYTLDGEAILGSNEGSEWRWSVRGPTNSATRNAESPNEARTRVYFDVSGDYEVTLTVVDEKGARQACTWIVKVAGAGLRVEARWDTYGRADIDLHLHRSGSTRGFCTDDDCYFANCRGGGRNWGYPNSGADLCPGGAGTCRNPRLDIDNVRGNQPENINLDNPNDGDSFRVMTHLYSITSGTGPTHPVVSIYCGGLLRSVLGEAPDRVPHTSASSSCRGHTWRPADVIMQVDAGTGATSCEVNVLLNASGDWDLRLNNTSR